MVWVMTKNTYRSMLPLLWLAAACASHPAVPLTPLEIPSYPADDPRTETGGFVREVRLVEVESDATNYILMAWRTGEILTLGAMTQGPFEGDVRWSINGAVLDFTAELKPASQHVVVRATGAPPAAADAFGETAGFRDYRWTNIELKAPLWITGDECSLTLTFQPKTGSRVSLPTDGVFAARLVAR